MKHPKGLYLIFAVEMWERFSYYGMRALLVLFLTAQLVNGGLGFSAESASLLYGVFTGLIYFTPLIGGYLADNFIGQRRAISWGLLLLMAGQFSLAFSESATMVYVGLLLMILGNGFFKPNCSILVGSLYPEGDSRIDSAFTIFYMGINIGGFLAPLVTGWLAVEYGFRYGFLAAAVGLLFGYACYLALGNSFLGEIGKKPAGRVAKSSSNTNDTLSHEEKQRIGVLVILTAFAIAFFAGYEQAGCSMTLFTDQYVNRNILDFEVPTAWVQSLNPLLILVLAPAMSTLWSWLGAKGREPSIPVKMGWGLILLGVGFIFMIGAIMERGGDIDDIPNVEAKAGLWWVAMAFLFHTIGELCLSPIGLSMVSRLAPVKLASLFMGVWLASSAVANFLAGYLSSLTANNGCYEVFLALTVVSILLGILLIAIRKPMLKMSNGKL